LLYWYKSTNTDACGAAFQGIQLSKLGSEENALQAASKKLVEVVPPLQLKMQKEQVQPYADVCQAECCWRMLTYAAECC
jgi:hypothetical protein